jgi:photosystem II stability/assembly factor-like uncharacterized protein
MAGSAPAAAAVHTPAAAGVWEPLGGPVGPGGQGNAIATNPAVAGEVYVALIPPGAGGIGPSTIFRSEDAADTWSPVFTTTIALHALAAQENLVLAGGYSPVSGVVAYHSHDHGLHWTPSFTLPTDGGWFGLSIDPADSLHALAGGTDTALGVKQMRGQVYGTTDGGVTWTPQLQVVSADEATDVAVSAVLIHPLTPTLQLAAAAAGGDAVIWRSVDGGVNWTAAYTITNAAVRSLVAFWERPNLIYAGVGNSLSGGSASAVYRSEDAGLTWAKVQEPGTFVAVSPWSVVAVTTWGESFRSTGDGDPGSWTQVGGTDSAAALAVEYPPAAQAAQPLSLTTATFYLGANEWGAQRSRDSGDTWTNQSNGLATLVRPRSIAVNPVDPRHLYVAAGCGGRFVSHDGGQNWAMVDDVPGCMGTFAFDPADPTIIFGGGYEDSAGALLRSADGGLTFTRVYTASHIKPDHSGGGENLFAVASTPLSPTLVLAGGEDYPAGESSYGIILRSVDRGLHWVQTAKVVGGAVEAMVIDPTDVRRAWAGGRACGEGGCGGFVLRSIDAGQTWTVTLVTSDTVASLSYDRFTGALYAGDRNYKIRKSDDGGLHWSVVRAVDGSQGIGSGYLVTVEPFFPDRAILAGYQYVAETLDGGATWSDGKAAINTETPAMEPGALALDTRCGVQTIYGGFTGVWRYARPGPSCVQLPQLVKQQ